MRDGVMKRKSRRTFLRRPVEADELQELQEVIDQVNAEGQLGLRLVEDGGKLFTDCGPNYGGGVFTGVRTLIAVAGQKDDPNMMEKCGYYGEQVLLQAVELDLGTCWVGVDYDYASNALGLGRDEQFALFIVLGYVPTEMPVLEKRFWEMSRNTYKRPSDFYDSDVSPAPGWLISGASCASQAPSALNSQKPHFSYRDGVLTACVPEDVDPFVMDPVDLGIAKYHFELGAGGRFDWGNPGVYHPAV